MSMNKHIPILAACTIATVAFAQIAVNKVGSADLEIVRAADVSWGALNPARGEKGPRAGSLWNDRTTDNASGFLVRFADGFSSPPHIHNVTYRGVVISGLVHNDDPDAAEMWMPVGSFWTQPAGEVHITAAKGGNVMAYIEIDSGPYLVLPDEDAFDKGERPINIVPSNLVWLSSSQTNWIVDVPQDSGIASPEIAFLWGAPASGKKSGSFLRLPKGFSGVLEAGDSLLRIVIVKGTVNCSRAEGDTSEILSPGEYFTLPGKQSSYITAGPDDECIVYLHANDFYLLRASK